MVAQQATRMAKWAFPAQVAKQQVSMHAGYGREGNRFAEKNTSKPSVFRNAFG